MSATLHYPDGSITTIDYLATAFSKLPKEHVELSADGKTILLDYFRHTSEVGERGHRTLNQDTGQHNSIRTVLSALHAKATSPLDLKSVENVSRVTLALVESTKSGSQAWVNEAPQGRLWGRSIAESSSPIESLGSRSLIVSAGQRA